LTVVWTLNPIRNPNPLSHLLLKLGLFLQIEKLCDLVSRMGLTRIGKQ